MDYDLVPNHEELDYQNQRKAPYEEDRAIDVDDINL